MQPVDDIGIAIADVYGKALFALASAANAETSLLEELGELVGYVNGNADFEHYLTSATVDAEARRAGLEKTLRTRASDLLVDFLQVLNNKERLPLLEQIATQFRLAFEMSRDQVGVTVITAAPLTPAARESLLQVLRQRTAKEPLITEQVDASLIGGMVIHIGDEKIDYSVTRRLRGYRANFLTRASHEIHSGREYFVEG